MDQRKLSQFQTKQNQGQESFVTEEGEVALKGPALHKYIEVINVHLQHIKCQNMQGRNLGEAQGEADSPPAPGDRDTSSSPHFQEGGSRQGAVRSGSAISHLDLIDIYRAHHPPAARYTFFPSSQGTLAKTDTLGHKTTLTNPVNHSKYALGRHGIN